MINYHNYHFHHHFIVVLLFLFVRFGLLFVAPLLFTSNFITAEYPTYELEDISFSDLVVLDSSCAVKLAQVLTKDGALQITSKSIY